MYSISFVSSVVTLNTSVTEKNKNAMNSTVLKLMNIALYSISHYSHQLLYQTHLIMISH